MIPFEPFTLVLVATIALLLAGAFSPLETLGWWAGWYGDRADEEGVEPSPDAGRRIGEAPEEPERFVVYLSGIDSVSDQPVPKRQVRFLEDLCARLPEAAVVLVFPYSVTNRALTGERVFAWFWRWALQRKLGQRRLDQIAGMLINFRNMWQVMVSADRRYGPFYDRGTAALMVRALRQAGYRPGSGVPITLIGYSGGGQVAVGATPFVREALGAPVTVLSLAGVMAADPGLLSAEKVVHIVGAGDRVVQLGALLAPGRWPLLPYSPWNEAKRRGTLRELLIGPCDHTGSGGYMDDAAFVADGRSYYQVTVEVLAALVRDPTGPAPVAAPVAAPTA